MDYFVLSKKLQVKLILLQQINPNKAGLFRVVFTGGVSRTTYPLLIQLYAKQSI